MTLIRQRSRAIERPLPEILLLALVLLSDGGCGACVNISPRHDNYCHVLTFGARFDQNFRIVDFMF